MLHLLQISKGEYDEKVDGRFLVLIFLSICRLNIIKAEKQDRFNVEKQAKRSGFFIFSSKDNGGDAKIGSNIIYFLVSDKVLDRAAKWANGGPPALIVFVKDGKMQKIYMEADSWSDGKITLMHSTAKKFIGLPAYSNNLKKLNRAILFALEKQFTK